MLAILYEDPHLLVVNKPAGLATQGPGGLSATVEAEVRRHLRPVDPASVYLGTVHRLDRPVSGAILWAKTPKAARRVAEQFAHREAQKEYWALVSGRPEPPTGRWEDWLCLEDTGLDRVQLCRLGTPRARPAVTRYAVGPGARLPEGWTWLRLWPETGRRHQLRVQAAARGLPIVGDRLYGSPEAFPLGIALHARWLTIRHPVLDQPMTFEAPLPSTWEAYSLAADA
jgi:23S rRNA pseudouridine1911/1915/1917 synthase